MYDYFKMLLKVKDWLRHSLISIKPDKTFWKQVHFTHDLFYQDKLNETQMSMFLLLFNWDKGQLKYFINKKRVQQNILVVNFHWNRGTTESYLIKILNEQGTVIVSESGIRNGCTGWSKNNFGRLSASWDQINSWTALKILLLDKG